MFIASDVLQETASRENNKAREIGAGGLCNKVTRPEHVWTSDQIMVDRAWDVQVTIEEVPLSVL